MFTVRKPWGEISFEAELRIPEDNSDGKITVTVDFKNDWMTYRRTVSDETRESEYREFVKKFQEGVEDNHFIGMNVNDELKIVNAPVLSIREESEFSELFQDEMEEKWHVLVAVTLCPLEDFDSDSDSEKRNVPHFQITLTKEEALELADYLISVPVNIVEQEGAD